jgi:hypothetical protein
MTRSLFIFLLLIMGFGIGLAPHPLLANGPEGSGLELHNRYDVLLRKYVVGLGVDYSGWVANGEDVSALRQYVTDLTALDPGTWTTDEQLAYWLNLYNAVTVRLILDNYPLESIKDLGGFLKKSPWERELVSVAGRDLSLNDIENEIIRPTFQDPRIHFALNCASVGCPPLKAGAYFPATLSEQLDAVCRRALNEDQWVRVENDQVFLTKIFEWYADDFKQDGGSVLGFISGYRDTDLVEGQADLVEGQVEVKIMDYDWSLNETKR